MHPCNKKLPSKHNTFSSPLKDPSCPSQPFLLPQRQPSYLLLSPKITFA